MCQQCYTRSAAILAAILTCSPLPTPTPEEIASTHGDWDASMVEILRRISCVVDEHARTKVENVEIEKLLQGLTIAQLDSFTSMVVSINRHIAGFAKMGTSEIMERAASGNVEAIALIAKKAIQAMTQAATNDSEAVTDLLKDLDKAPRPIDPSLN